MQFPEQIDKERLRHDPESVNATACLGQTGEFPAKTGAVVLQQAQGLVLDPETGGPIKPASSAPRSGNDQFDQIWRAEDADGNKVFVVVEAKSRADTRLGERELEENGVVTKKVKQGTREYFESILEEMRLRGGEEKKLARDIRRAMRNNRVHYVVARGNPDGKMHGGHSMRLFNITGRDIR